MKRTAKELAGDITDYVNVFNSDTVNKEFVEAMATEHRTLQQSFTRLCLSWLEHCASAEYKYDGRNAATKLVADQMIKSFKKDHGFNPSETLPFI